MDEPVRKYLNIDELCLRTGLSKSTIHRLKKSGMVRFYQPGGKGGRVLFPPDAIEQVTSGEQPTADPDQDTFTSKSKLSGPQPKWMSPDKPK